jgi:hypothetical protein
MPRTIEGQMTVALNIKAHGNKFFPILVVAGPGGYAVETSLTMLGFKLQGDAQKVLDATAEVLEANYPIDEGSDQ